MFDRLLSLQRANGHWSVKFDPNYPITEMQTGESLYALALAGLTPDHPAVRQGIVALLGRQQAFGGWFDVNPYEQFRTPFRETQWALMALSSLYPNVKAHVPGLERSAWAAAGIAAYGFAGDADRATSSASGTFPGPISRGRSIAQLGHQAPLVRAAACRTLGRVGDESAIAPLARGLGDESKVVRRAAAEALRLMGNRLNGSHSPGETPEPGSTSSPNFAPLCVDR